MAASPWLSKALAVLADGQWHDRERVMSIVMPLVPPGRAHRESERQRNRQRALGVNAPATRLIERSDAFLVKSGRRSIVVNSLVKCSQIEHRRDPDGKVFLRRRSEASSA